MRKVCDRHTASRHTGAGRRRENCRGAASRSISQHNHNHDDIHDNHNTPRHTPRNIYDDLNIHDDFNYNIHDDFHHNVDYHFDHYRHH